MANLNTAGLRIDPSLNSSRVSSLSMTFEPSIGIMARRVDKLGLDIRSFREPLHRAVKEVVIPSIAMNFAKHGRPRWAPLAEATINQRHSKGTGARILDRTGLLRRTMGQLNVWHIDTEKALIANLPSKIWYGVVHQKGVGDPNALADMWYDPVLQREVNVGEGAGQINIPARPFVMIQPEDENKIDAIFSEWLAERVMAAGFGYPRPTRGGII